MATVNWATNVYGFDFRKLLLSSVSPTFGGQDPASFEVLDVGPGGFGPAKDTYHGSFTYGVTSGDVSGTVTAITRLESGFTMTVTGLNLQVNTLNAAATTADKEDDLQIWASAFSGNDGFAGGSSNDRFEGFAGNDTLLGFDGNDTLDGGEGSDLLNADLGKHRLYGRGGKDTLLGGAGDDWLDGGSGQDLLAGGAGNDTLYGNIEQDFVSGGRGADKLYGGAGNDTFIYASAAESTVTRSGRDTIFDFSSREKDKIELTAIDANSKRSGDQAFQFIDKQAFHKKAGELRWAKVTGGVDVYGDTNGDGKSDFAIFLKGLTKIAKTDFYL